MFRKIIKPVLRILAFVGALYVWLLFTYNTLDRSVEAQQFTSGGYVLDKFSVLILSVIIFFFLAKPILSKKFSIKSIASKIIFAIFLLFGIYIFVNAVQFKQQYPVSSTAPKEWEFTSNEVFGKLNEYRKKHDVEPIILEPSICNKLESRYQILKKDPNNQQESFDQWVENAGLNQYAPMTELWVITKTADRAIEFLRDKKDGTKEIILGDFNVGCIYVKNGFSLVFLGTKPSNSL